MSKDLSYLYTGTKGHISAVAISLPKTGAGLVSRGWEEISHPKQAAAGAHTYREPSTGLRVRYDEPVPGTPGFAGKHHYHILNPNATSSRDMYLDKNGNPCARGSKESHILPEGE